MRNFRLIPIRAGRLNVRALAKSLLDGLAHEMRIIGGDLSETVATWEGEKPVFKYTHVERGDDIVGQQVPTGSEHAVNKWNWLNSGTSIRWALMSQDWSSKTSPGTLRSTSGSGQVLIKGMGAMAKRGIAPRPGIEARDWTGIISKRHDIEIVRRIYDYLDKAARRAFL